jgi:hypothetical protein
MDFMLMDSYGILFQTKPVAEFDKEDIMWLIILCAEQITQVV